MYEHVLSYIELKRDFIIAVATYKLDVVLTNQ